MRRRRHPAAAEWLIELLLLLLYHHERNKTEKTETQMGSFSDLLLKPFENVNRNSMFKMPINLVPPTQFNNNNNNKPH